MTDNPTGRVSSMDGCGNGFHTQLFPIVFLTVLFSLNFTARIILSPLAPAIETDLGLSHGEMGTFFFMITVGYFVSLVGSGFVSARFTHRVTITVSAVVLGIVLICLSCVESMWILGAGMLAIGLAAGIYLPAGIATITHLVDARQWGKALAIHEMAPSIAFVAAPLIAEGLMIWFPWRGVMALIGIGSAAIGILFALFGRGGDIQGERPNFASLSQIIRTPSFFVMVVLFSLGISSTIGVYAMLPTYLFAEHGMTRAAANTLVSLSRVATLVFVFVGGWANDRFGSMRTMMVTFVITGLTTILIGVAATPWIAPVVILQPMAAVCFFPAGFSVLSSIVPPQARNLAISLALPVGFMVGAGLVPTGIGIMGDAGVFPWGYMILGTCITAGVVLAWTLRIPE